MLLLVPLTRIPLVRGRVARIIIERRLAQRPEVPLLTEPVDALLLGQLVASLVAEHAVVVDGEIHGEVAELRQGVGKRPLELSLAPVLVLGRPCRGKSGR